MKLKIFFELAFGANDILAKSQVKLKLVFGASGFLAVRTFLRLIGATGEAGMTILDLVQNPQNAFMTVFSYLAGAGVGREGFIKAAQARRSMSAKEVNSLGNVKNGLQQGRRLRPW